eukprot:Pgem_evm1s9761
MCVELNMGDTTPSSYVRNELGIIKLEYQLIKLVSRDINMNKWNDEVRKRINRKEFRDFTTDIHSKSKCDLYKRVNSRKIYKKLYINPRVIIINDISCLKFKLLSNTSGLNEKEVDIE